MPPVLSSLTKPRIGLKPYGVPSLKFVSSICLTEEERYIIDTIMTKVSELSKVQKDLKEIEKAVVLNQARLNQYLLNPENSTAHDAWDTTYDYYVKSIAMRSKLYQKLGALHSFFSNFSSTSNEITKTAISGLSKSVILVKEKLSYIEEMLQFIEIRIVQLNTEKCSAWIDQTPKRTELAQQKEELHKEFMSIKLTGAFFAKSALALSISPILDADILKYDGPKNENGCTNADTDCFMYADHNYGGLILN